MGGRLGDKFVGRSELPVVEVNIKKPFFLGIFPVTEEEFAEYEPSYPTSNLPVVSTTWIQATSYCDWLSEQISRNVRLPTEAEWEYACRAGSDFIFQRGDTLETEHACFLYDESGQRVGAGSRTPLGTFPSNALGLYDMLGNVCEWTDSDWTQSLDPNDPRDSSYKVIRGGAWDYLPRLLRVSWRDSFSPDRSRDNIGFRILIEE